MTYFDYKNASPGEPLGESLWWLAGIASVALIGLGVYAMVDPAAAAGAYGLPSPPAPSPNAWIGITGLRDLVVGVLALVFTVERDRRSLGVTALVGALIPIGDGVTVLRYASEPMPFILIHWASAAGCLLFAWLLLRGVQPADR